MFVLHVVIACHVCVCVLFACLVCFGGHSPAKIDLGALTKLGAY